jgi:hypothetical protein
VETELRQHSGGHLAPAVGTAPVGVGAERVAELERQASHLRQEWEQVCERARIRLMTVAPVVQASDDTVAAAEAMVKFSILLWFRGDTSACRDLLERAIGLLQREAPGRQLVVEPARCRPCDGGRTARR